MTQIVRSLNVYVETWYKESRSGISGANNYCFISHDYTNLVCRNIFFLFTQPIPIQIQLFWSSIEQEQWRRSLIKYWQHWWAEIESWEEPFFKLSWWQAWPTQLCSLEIKLYLSLAEFFVTNKRQRLLL